MKVLTMFAITVVGFGDRFENLFPSSVELNEDNLQRATAYVDRLDASFGMFSSFPLLSTFIFLIDFMCSLI
jgi:hypothetical protein